MQTFCQSNNLNATIAFLLVGATVSDFGLPWDLLAEIDFFGLKLFFEKKSGCHFFLSKLGLLETILKTIITNT